MRDHERERLAGAAVLRYGEYVGSGTYWRDKKRSKRRMHEAYLQCVRADLLRFREQVVEALRCLEADVLPSKELAGIIAFLRGNIGRARRDLAAREWEGGIDGAWGARDYRRHHRAVEVAECLIELVRLEG